MTKKINDKVPQESHKGFLEGDLDIFSSPEIQTSIIGENMIEFFPINPLTSSGPIQFDIPETFSQMTDPSFLLKVKAKIVKGDGTNLTDDSKAAPANLLLHSMFKDVVLKVNNTIVANATGTYPYRAFIETHFTYSTTAKEGAVGQPQMYYPDTAGQENSSDAAMNPAYGKRKQKFAKSATVEMAGRLHCDLLMQDKLIIPGVKFSVQLYPHNDAFRLLNTEANPTEKLIIQQVILKVRRVTLNSSMLLSIERALKLKPASYPIMRAVVRTAQIGAGQMNVSNLMLYNGQVPRLIIATLVPSFVVNGAYTRSPYLFHLFNATKAQVECNGRLYPPVPYDFKNSPVEVYLNTLRMVNKLYTDSSTGITLDDFTEGSNAILPFDLAPDDSGIPARTNGVVNLNLDFGTAPDQNQMLIYYMLWDNVIKIDSNRNVILDYIP